MKSASSWVSFDGSSPALGTGEPREQTEGSHVILDMGSFHLKGVMEEHLGNGVWSCCDSPDYFCV